jgi:hypothetical protein
VNGRPSSTGCNRRLGQQPGIDPDWRPRPQVTGAEPGGAYADDRLHDPEVVKAIMAGSPCAAPEPGALCLTCASPTRYVGHDRGSWLLACSI